MPASRRDDQTPERQRRVEELRREQAASERRRAGLILAAAVAVLAVAVVGAWKVIGSDDEPAGSGYAPDVALTGVEEFEVDSDHVITEVDYPQAPPVGGPHNPIWLNCGTYEDSVPNENAVHSLEHGAVWVAYRPDLPVEDVDSLRALGPDTFTVLSPYDGLSSPVVISAWGRQLAVDSVDDPRIREFIAEYRLGGISPEAGASCTGGSDGTLPLDAAAAP